MKKKITIIYVVLIALSLTVFGFVNQNNSKESTESNNIISDESSSKKKIENRIFTDFIYEIGPRFSPIKKSHLAKLKTFNEIIGMEHAQKIASYKSVSVIIMNGDKRSDIRETGNTNEFTNAQLEFLQALDYSTNIVIWADYLEKNSRNGELQHNSWTPHLTIVPEIQAEYQYGEDFLKNYLKEYSEETRTKAGVEPEKLQPAKLYFTITKTGTIENVRLDRTSNYPLVDKRMIELIKNAPGAWQPAENYKGEKVSQELVISFGLMGC